MSNKRLIAVLVAMFVALSGGFAMAQNTVNGVDGTNLMGLMATDGVSLPAFTNDIHINPGGLGDALIFGYYNARDAATYFNIVNTSPSTAIKARVRFREAVSSVEILDFNVCLSAGDKWSALVLPPETAGGPGQVLNLDSDTVTFPTLTLTDLKSNLIPNIPSIQEVDPDETLEGYIEVIADAAWADINPPLTDPFDADEDLCRGDGLPHSCTTGDDCFPENTLMGTAQVIPLDRLTSFGYNATAIANCDPTIDFLFGGQQPTLDECQGSLAELEYGLTKNDVFASWEYTNPWDAMTEIILTFPTMNFWADFLPVDVPLFDNDLDVCETNIASGVLFNPDVIFTVDLWNDREEQPTSQLDFSPFPVGQQIFLCNEVNVIGIGSGTAIMNSNVRATIGVGEFTQDNGWVGLNLASEINHFTTVGAHTTRGLPAIGYRLHQLFTDDDDVPELEIMTPIHFDTQVTTN